MAPARSNTSPTSNSNKLAAKATVKAVAASEAPAPVETPRHLQPPPPPPPTPTREDDQSAPVEATANVNADAVEAAKDEPHPAMETYHDFFKQQRAMNCKNYIKLKKAEKLTLKKFQSAVLIQKVFRGWRIRENMRLVHHAATVIQAAWRGLKGRERYKVLDEARQARQLSDLLDKMATRIQAAWRGYWSRKNKLNFKRFKDLQQKNNRAEEHAKAAGELENLVASSSFDSVNGGTGPAGAEGERELKKTNSAMLQSLANMLDGDLTDLASKMTPSRVAQLYTLAKSTNQEGAGRAGAGANGKPRPLRRSQLEKLAAKLAKSDKHDKHDKYDGRGCGSCAPDESLAVLMKSIDASCSCGPDRDRHSDECLEQKRSSFYMFPELPGSDDYVHSDPVKVQVLREAIRLLRDALQREEVNKLGKYHYLLRTVVIPGVYSDIYTNELTDMEQKLKSLKFYESKPQPQQPLAPNGNRLRVKKLVPGGGKPVSKPKASRSKMSSNELAQVQFQSKKFDKARTGTGTGTRGSCDLTVSPAPMLMPVSSATSSSYPYSCCSTPISVFDTDTNPYRFDSPFPSPYSTSKLIASPCSGPGISPSNSAAGAGAGVWKPLSRC